MKHIPSPVGVALIPVTPFAQNCTLLWCTRTADAVLVDPGGEAERLLAAAEEQGVHIKAVWLTHGHLDHAGAAAVVQDRLGVPIIGPHREDAFWLDAIEAQAAQYGLAGQMVTCKPDQWLEDGDSVTVGEVTFGVAHCPGHTPGHVVFHSAALELAFVGDVLFQGSIGRTDFPRGDHAQLLDSIKNKLWPLGDAMRFVPGHGPMSTFGAERRTNPFVADHVLG